MVTSVWCGRQDGWQADGKERQEGGQDDRQTCRLIFRLAVQWIEKNEVRMQARKALEN